VRADQAGTPASQLAVKELQSNQCKDAVKAMDTGAVYIEFHHNQIKQLIAS